VVTRTLKIKWFLASLFSAAFIFPFNAIYAGEQEKSFLMGGGFPSQELVSLFQKGDQILDFRKIEGPTYYSPENLFDYINGGAELFLAYGFLELLVVELAEDRDRADRATLEIYNMGTLGNAFGVFKTEAGNKVYRLPGGSEGRLENGFLQFYKGKFYVKVFLSPQPQADPRVVEEIGKTIEARIKGSFSQPAFFALFPVRYRIEGSEKYTSKDFLGQSFFKGIASADYKQGGKAYTIFISVKPHREEAEKAFQKYREYLISEKVFQGELKGGIRGFISKDPYYGQCSISIIGGRIVGILGTPENAVSILKSIGEGKW